MSSPLGSTADLLEEMRARAARGEGQTSPFTVTRSCGEFEIVFRVADADRLGVLVDGVEVVGGGGPPSPDALDGQARALMAGVSALGDRFALIEIEPRLDRAVLRSTSPRLLPEGLEYDEIVLHGGRRASLKRYRFDRTRGTRAPVPSNLAAEVVPRLARELGEAFTRASSSS